MKMAKIPYESDMFYPGFPVFIGLTKLADGEVLATTYSSSYMLEDVLVMGAGSDGQTASNLAVGSWLSANFLSHSELDGLLSDTAGLVSRRTKVAALEAAGAVISEENGGPILQNGLLTVLGQIEQIIETEGIRHFIVRIKSRLINDALLDSNEGIDWAKFDTLEYFGSRKTRLYKAVTGDSRPKGEFLKAARKQFRQARKKQA